MQKYETPLAEIIKMTDKIDVHQLHDYENHVDHHKVRLSITTSVCFIIVTIRSCNAK